MSDARPRLIRIDLSPPEFIHVPQAPRIERHAILSRAPGNEWHMSGVSGLREGVRVGVSNHTWSHLDAPYHLLPDGPTLDRIDPRRYLAVRTRVVDLTSTTPERRETIEGIGYHTRIAREDLPSALDGFDAVLFVTGFSATYAAGYPMRPGADEHYPNITEEAAEQLAGITTLRIVAIDAPSVDKPSNKAIAHRLFLGRRPNPVLLLETLTTERLRAHVRPLPSELLLTIEPLRAFGAQSDGALSSVYAYAAVAGEEAFFRSFVDAIVTARLVS